MAIPSVHEKEKAQEKCSYILKQTASLPKSNQSFSPESHAKLERTQ